MVVFELLVSLIVAFGVYFVACLIYKNCTCSGWEKEGERALNRKVSRKIQRKILLRSVCIVHMFGICF